MILCIAGVLSADELAQIGELSDRGEFADGKLTAGWYARDVKNNLQMRGSDVAKEMTAIVMTALNRNDLFQMATRPKTIRPPLFSRYEAGMSYGTHADNAVMTSQSHPMRTDLSLTLFLSPPDDYEGGELVIDSTQGEQAFKLDAGAMVLYPSSTLHRVDPVSSGRRFVAVSWVQSLVRSPEHRELLFDLDTARRKLFQQQGKSDTFDLLTKTQSNLMRMWAEI